jgi:hypothetical protein
LVVEAAVVLINQALPVVQVEELHQQVAVLALLINQDNQEIQARMVLEIQEEQERLVLELNNVQLAVVEPEALENQGLIIVEVEMVALEEHMTFQVHQQLTQAEVLELDLVQEVILQELLDQVVEDKVQDQELQIEVEAAGVEDKLNLLDQADLVLL